ncbi:hypothetical protein QWZ03_18220 [Chitinimonas viridis]|uniref:DUF2190 family protein n=1 Tax=Chitinimonas viridis TaxID=664880 RepID=A0ABT8B986_9NEIS|nr:hypothetical protein [Chitinimonas viridis]MDN3578706.1 hypothetical protein [Chitinimonas viridis]
MATTTQDRNTPLKDGQLIPVAVAAGTKIPGGVIVCANAAGFAVNGATASTLTYLGVADNAVDNSGGGDGAQVVLVRRGKAAKFANDAGDPVNQTSLGKPAYIVDNQTVARTHGANTRSVAGIVLGIDADGVWII